MAEAPRFCFHPLERRGVVLGLQPAQLLTMGGGMVAGLAAHAAIGGPAGAWSGVLVALGSVVASVWTRGGRPLIAWAALGLGWAHRRAGRARLNPEPLGGRPAEAVTGATVPAGSAPARRHRRSTSAGLEPGRGPVLAGLEIVEVERGLTDAGYGAVRDRRSGAWTAVVPVRGRNFSLLDPEDQVQRLEGWRTVLGALGRPSSPISRIQWVLSSGPVGPRRPALSATDGRTGPGRARDSYAQLEDAVVPVAQTHDIWLALTLGWDRRARSSDRPAGLGRELRFLEGQLRQADLDPGPPLDPVDLGRVLGSGAMAVREGWGALQIDGDWHATYWVAEWPRVEVGPGFLLPLLMGRGRRAASVLMAPVPADRALREVRSARTADLADAQLRARAGFLDSARRDREAEGVARRELELAEGHAEYRFSAYVTVSADGEDGLAEGCAELEQAAQAARLEVRRLYGRQAEAYAWTRPAGRGLR